MGGFGKRKMRGNSCLYLRNCQLFRESVNTVHVRTDKLRSSGHKSSLLWRALFISNTNSPPLLQHTQRDETPGSALNNGETNSCSVLIHFLKSAVASCDIRHKTQQKPALLSATTHLPYCCSENVLFLSGN